MADIALSSIIDGGSLPRLAPDLNFIVDKHPLGYTAVNFDPSGGLTTALSLTGKFAIPFLRLVNIASESYTVKLTIDGVVIWNSSRSLANEEYLLGQNTGNWADIPIMCNSSFLLEVQSTADSSVFLFYTARPIL